MSQIMQIWTVLVVLCSIGIKSSYGDDECGVVADIAFILDKSVSIWEPNFDKSKEFVQAIIKSFPIGPDKTHIAALTFAREVDIEFKFDEYMDADADKVAERIGNIPFTHGDQTHTHKALNNMTDVLFDEENGARDPAKVPRICVILTDGESTYSNDTLEAAKAARKAGIKIIAIGIGNKVDKDEIKAIATDPDSENAIFKDKFDDLENSTFQQLVAHKACKVTKTTTTQGPTTKAPTTTTTEEVTTTTELPTTTTTTTQMTTTTTMQKDESKKECQGKKVDVLFVLDMSTSIWEVDFTRQLKFVSDVVDSFDIESGKTRVGLMTFSDQPKLGFNFNTYKNKGAVKSAVRKTAKDGGLTNTHLALGYALDMFTPEHGSRPDVSHICILITDGISKNPKETKKVAKQLHKKGIYVFAVGVGNMTDLDELRSMASEPADKHTFKVNGYEALPIIRDILAYKACKVPGDQSRCLKDASVKIMFGLYGIRPTHRPYVFDLIRRVSGGFNLKSGKVSIGFEEACSNATLKLRPYSSNTDLQADLSNAMAYGISDMIVRVRNSFIRRSKSDQVTILLVSERADDMSRAKAEAKRLQVKSKVIVVYVGEVMSAFKEFASNPATHVFAARDENGFQYVSKRILDLICKTQ